VTHLRKTMLEELQRRNLSELTAECYLRAVEEFSRFHNRPPDQLGPEEIRQYQAHLFTDRKLDANTVCQHLSALRFFFIKTLKRRWTVEETPYPKRAIRLPDVLSREEVERLIDSADSPLHRVWLSTLYATGMRREELVQLKVENIDSPRMLIHIQQGKGKKDRDVMLSPRLLEQLRGYWRSANPKPKTYLFSGWRTRPRQRRADVRQERLPRRQTRCRPGRNPETSAPAHPASLFRNASARQRRGSADYSTAARPRGSENHQPLPASVRGAAQGNPEPARRTQAGGTARRTEHQSQDR